MLNYNTVTLEISGAEFSVGLESSNFVLWSSCRAIFRSGQFLRLHFPRWVDMCYLLGSSDFTLGLVYLLWQTIGFKCSERARCSWWNPGAQDVSLWIFYRWNAVWVLQWCQCEIEVRFIYFDKYACLMVVRRIWAAIFADIVVSTWHWFWEFRVECICVGLTDLGPWCMPRWIWHVLALIFLSTFW